jgi:hypothetical protein
MAMKAIKITVENQERLASKYQVEPDDIPDVLPKGMWLVADFGNEENFDVLSDMNYENTFTELGPIENDFIAIEYSDAV